MKLIIIICPTIYPLSIVIIMSSSWRFVSVYLRAWNDSLYLVGYTRPPVIFGGRAAECFRRYHLCAERANVRTISRWTRKRGRWEAGRKPKLHPGLGPRPLKWPTGGHSYVTNPNSWAPLLACSVLWDSKCGLSWNECCEWSVLDILNQEKAMSPWPRSWWLIHFPFYSMLAIC